jgi:hypothetical protein
MSVENGASEDEQPLGRPVNEQRLARPLVREQEQASQVEGEQQEARQVEKERGLISKAVDKARERGLVDESMVEKAREKGLVDKADEAIDKARNRLSGR